MTGLQVLLYAAGILLTAYIFHTAAYEEGKMDGRAEMYKELNDVR